LARKGDAPKSAASNRAGFEFARGQPASDGEQEFEDVIAPPSEFYADGERSLPRGMGVNLPKILGTFTPCYPNREGTSGK
jgi:hypothetical protein